MTGDPVFTPRKVIDAAMGTGDFADAARVRVKDEALRLALPVLRDDLRSLVECGTVRDETTMRPRPRTLDADTRHLVEASLKAVRACEAALGERIRGDEEPDWIDDVIDGRIEL